MSIPEEEKSNCNKTAVQRECIDIPDWPKSGILGRADKYGIQFPSKISRNNINKPKINKKVEVELLF